MVHPGRAGRPGPAWSAAHQARPAERRPARRLGPSPGRGGRAAGAAASGAGRRYGVPPVGSARGGQGQADGAGRIRASPEDGRAVRRQPRERLGALRPTAGVDEVGGEGSAGNHPEGRATDAGRPVQDQGVRDRNGPGAEGGAGARREQAAVRPDRAERLVQSDRRRGFIRPAGLSGPALRRTDVARGLFG